MLCLSSKRISECSFPVMDGFLDSTQCQNRQGISLCLKKMFVACLSFQDNHSVLSSIILISVNEKNAPCFHFVKILIPKCRIYGNVMLNLKKKKIPAWYILQVQLTKTYIFIQGFSFIVKLNFLNRTRQTTVSCLITCTLASKQDINLSLVVFPRVKLAFFVNET